MPSRGQILDLGCGINSDLDEYRSPTCDVWGTDFEEHPSLNHATWFRKLANNGAIPFANEQFNLVAARMVLEHVEHPARFLSEVSRVLRPGGHLVGHTISGSHYVTWLRRLFGVLPHSFNQSLVRLLYGRAEVDTFPAFYRMNTIQQIRAAAEGTGLIIRQVRRYADPGYFHFSTMTRAAAVAMDRTLATLQSGLGRLYFTIVLQKST